eukprot:jgi/Psemu1/18910/gm1.18910_g
MRSSNLQKRRQERTIVTPHIFADQPSLVSPDPVDVAENDNDGVEANASYPLVKPPSGSFEASLHQLPRTLNSEIEVVFPEIASQARQEKRLKRKNNIGGGDNEIKEREYLVLPTFHVANFSILERNDRTEDERLRIFLRFRQFAMEFRNRLAQKDPQSQLDIPDIDGASTFSANSHTTSAYDEVASTRSILGYSTFLYMGVQIVHHPRIGYGRLAIHTIVMYADSKDAEGIYYELRKNYSKH